MTKPHIARWVIRRLNQSTGTIGPRAEWRLRQGREQAIAIARQQRAAQPALLTPAGDTFDLDNAAWQNLHRAIALLLFLALLFVAFSSTPPQHKTNPIDDIDTQMLSGDLPLSAYTDKDFQQWVDNSATH